MHPIPKELKKLYVDLFKTRLFVYNQYYNRTPAFFSDRRLIQLPSDKYTNFHFDKLLNLLISSHGNLKWTLSFTNCEFQEKFIHEFCAFLSANPSIDSIIFSKLKNKNKQLINTTYLISSLPETIHWIILDNVLTSNGLPSLCTLLQNRWNLSKGFEKIAIINHNFTEFELSPLFEELKFCSRICPQISMRCSFGLNWIDLSGNRLDENGCVRLLKSIVNIKIQALFLSNNGIKKGQLFIKELIKYIVEIKSLEIIDISHNQITEQNISLLVSSIVQENIKHLDMSFMFSNSSTEFENVIKLFLSSNSTIIFFDISGIRITPSLSKSILKLSSHHPTLSFCYYDLSNTYTTEDLQYYDNLIRNRKNTKVETDLPKNSPRSIKYDNIDLNQNKVNLMQSNSEIDVKIAFLFSSPLVLQGSSGKIKGSISLNLKSEKNIFLECIEESNREIDIKYITGTFENFIDVLEKGCLVLHFSGHGHKSGLTFEKEPGMANFILKERLCDTIIYKAKIVPKLIFIGCCYSADTGQSLINIGIDNVICLEDKGSDKDLFFFTKHFYLSLFRGKSISDSFNIASNILKIYKPAAYSNIITLKSRDPMKKDVILFPRDTKYAKSPYSELSSPTIKFKENCNFNLYEYCTKYALPSLPSPIVNRNKKVFKLLRFLLERKYLNLFGEFGIGKTTMVLQVCHFMLDRTYFNIGVYYLNMTKYDTVEEFISFFNSIITVDNEKKFIVFDDIDRFEANNDFIDFTSKNRFYIDR